MLSKSSLPFHGAYPELVFHVFILLGFLMGLIKGFPLWAYSYLGWCLVFAWWWMGMPMDTFRSYYSPLTHRQLLGWWSWLPLFITIGATLLWTRSLRPLRKLIAGIWQDWTLVSLIMFALVGWFMMMYDENHSPYLFAFMIASILTVSASVWIFIKSPSVRNRIIALLSGFVISLGISWTCDATWDWAAYYGITPSPPKPWYTNVTAIIAITVLWSAIMFWPAIIGLVHHIIDHRQ